MTESSFEQSRQARFGLADVSDAVRDYYDLLFDNVQEFIGMNHGEILEYERENDGLAAKLAGGGLEPSEDMAVRKTMSGNTERISEIRDFLNSDRVIPVGLDLSEDVLDGSEPELTDRFHAAPIAEKYACLMNRYMDEHRSRMEARVDMSRGDYLVEIDAFRFAAEKTAELFPKIAERYGEHKQTEYRELLRDYPFKLLDDLMVKYATEYVADAGQRLSEAKNNHDALQKQLLEHDAAKPGWLKNLATLGNAGKEWEGAREALTRKTAGFAEQMAELQSLREDCGESRLPESARREARKTIESRHPEVFEARKRHMARQWEEANAAYIERQRERQAERDDGNGQVRDDGLSR